MHNRIEEAGVSQVLHAESDLAIVILVEANLLDLSIAQLLKLTCVASFGRVDHWCWPKLHGFSEHLIVRLGLVGVLPEAVVIVLFLMPGAIVMLVFVKLVFARHYFDFLSVQ